MKLLIHTQQTELSSADLAYLKEKLGKMNRYLSRFSKLEIYIQDFRGGDKAGMDKSIEAVTTFNKKQIRVREVSDNIPGAVDMLANSLERVLRKTKEKRIDQTRRKRAWLKRLLPGQWLKRK